jgi:hypothetical protein
LLDLRDELEMGLGADSVHASTELYSKIDKMYSKIG